MSEFTTPGALVAAAAAILDAHGEHALTIRAVAARVGVSHNAPYKHFADKQELLAAVAAQSFRELRAELAGAAGDATSPLDALRRMAPAYLGYVRRHPVRYRLLFSFAPPAESIAAVPPGAPAVSGPLASLMREADATFQLSVEAIHAAQRSGELPGSIEALRLAALLYATIHGLADLTIGGQARAEKGLHPPDAVLTLLLDLLTRSR